MNIRQLLVPVSVLICVSFSMNSYGGMMRKEIGKEYEHAGTARLSPIVLSYSFPFTNIEYIDLSWTAYPDPFTTVTYSLYREFRGMTSLVVATTATDFRYRFWECNKDSTWVHFWIEVTDSQSGVVVSSDTAEVILKNEINALPVEIDSVSIIDGKAVIGWQTAIDPDIRFYVVSLFNPGGSATEIGSVEGRDSTFFMHVGSDPCASDGPVSYIMASKDSCGNSGPQTYDTATYTPKPQNTIHLQDILYDPCRMTNYLAWNKYINFDPPLAGYRIYLRDLNTGRDSLLATVADTVTGYLHESLRSNTQYNYFVRAFSQNSLKTSTSCVRGVTTYNSPRPEFMYIRYVTVENNTQVSLLFETDTNAHVQYYRILRSDAPQGPYEAVGQVPGEGLETVEFIDLTADVNDRSFFYQVEVVDSCGVDTVITNRSRTIFLTVNALEDYTNVLSWNAYETWGGDVEGYRIYRRINDGQALELLDEIGPAQQTYTDDVSGLTGDAIRMTYLVEAFEGPGNPLDFRESSFSNEVLAEQESRIYVPNAILPKGLNNVLKPVSVFVGSPGYEFLIYNRWGQLIFRTSDPYQGWDGTFQGSYVEAGLYVYLIRYRNAMGEVKVQKGNVAVIY